LSKKSDSWVESLETGLQFLKELGVDFLVAEKKERNKKDDLLLIHSHIQSCCRCPLARTRKNPVPGEGNFDADLMFVGEAPGVDEDAQGRPFVGRAGQLLTKIIEAMRRTREEVYITNVVKCRPPENRTPHPDEIEKCRGYLLAQVEIIKPRVIITLGKVATEFFVPVEGNMTSLRGNFYAFGDILVMPTFHPAYVLRNEGNKAIKKLVWQDMQKVMTVLGQQ